MQEQERLASEEQERRLKAALAASRTNASRVTSPMVTDSSQPSESQASGKAPTSENKSVAPSDANPNGQAAVTNTQSSGSDDVEMQNLESQISSPNKPSSPWVPELEALFEDVEKIVPKVVIDTLGCVQFLAKPRILPLNIVAVLVSILRSGNSQHMSSHLQSRSTTKKWPICAHSARKRGRSIDLRIVLRAGRCGFRRRFTVNAGTGTRNSRAC